MNAFLSWQRDLASTGWTTILSTIVDIALVTIAIYWLIVLSKRTRAWQIMWGLLFFLLLGFATEYLQLHVLNFLIKSFLPLGPVAIVILFYPELRQALENVGSFAGWGRGLTSLAKEEVSLLIQCVVKAALRMSEKRIGALIVIERERSLNDIIATGTRLNATVNEELLCTIFYPGSPLHDGAVVIRGQRIVAAGCTLPLSDSTNVGNMIHTRHKAALGLAEESDAAIVVVSEETGTISLAFEGKLHRGLNEEKLIQWLKRISGADEKQKKRSDFAKKVNGTIAKAKIKRK
ncbi:MAG: diadenylate cyclase CdaA [Armatimonadota bacterium]